MKWTYRNRIIIAAIVLSLCTQILLVGIGVLNVGKINLDLVADSNEKLLDVASYNVTAYLNQMNSMLNYFESDKFAEYVQSYLGFADSSLLMQKTESLDLLLDRINLADNLIDSVYLLSKYSFQKGIVFHTGEHNFSTNEFIPTIDELILTDLLPLLIYRPNQPVFFAPGELTRRFKSTKALTPKQLADVKKVAQGLEGRVVISGGVLGYERTSFMVIIVMKNGLLGNLVNDDPSTAFALLDSHGQIIDKTGLLRKPNINNQSKIITPSGLRLELYPAESSDIHATGKTALVKYLIFFIIIFLTTVITACTYSYYLIIPFRKMGHLMKKQGMFFPLQYISKDIVRNGVFPHVSLRNKLFILFFITVCIPTISSGIGFYLFSVNFSIEQKKPYVKQLSQQVSLNIHRQAIIYEDLINKLTLNNTFSNVMLGNDNLIKANHNGTPDISFLQYFGMSDVAYFIIYNSVGSVIYSNQSLINLMAVDISIKEKLRSSKHAIWVSNMNDIYNQPTVSLIKQVTNSNEVTNPNSDTIGYIQIVLNHSAFQTILLEKSGLLLTTDQAGDVLFQNDTTGKIFVKLKKIREKLLNGTESVLFTKETGVDGFATVNYIQEMNWYTYFIESMGPIITKRNELFVSYLFILFTSFLIAILFSFRLTRWLARSLEHLKLAMELQSIEVRMEQRIEYKDRDEVSDLIDNFNRMMAKINELMVTNVQMAEENSLNQMKQQKMIALQIQSELKMLQLQINPHFLYNTLQSIGMRANRSGQEEVGFMVYALAELFRYSISSNGDYTDLSEEIEHTRNYIAIQGFRFKDKFTVEWNVSDEATACKVIKFILQPLVENAISHGILNSVRNGKILISASIQNNVLHLSVSDNGVGIAPYRLSQILQQWEEGVLDESIQLNKDSIGGLGLNNVYFRLRLHYNGLARMEISSEVFEGTLIKLFIPQ